MVTPKQLANLRPCSSTHQPDPEKLRGPRGHYLTPLLKRCLKKKINYEDPETQKIIRGQVKDAVVWRLILNATQGEISAIKEIFERIDGKTPDKIEMPGPTLNLFIQNIVRKANLDTERETPESDTKSQAEPRRF